MHLHGFLFRVKSPEFITYHGFVDWRTSTRACNWCLNVSLTVGRPFVVPLVDVEFALPIRDTVDPSRSYKIKQYSVIPPKYCPLETEFNKNHHLPDIWWVHVRRRLTNASWNRIIRLVVRRGFCRQIRSRCT